MTLSKSMEEEVDIYGDLPSFNTNESDEIKALNKKCQDMEVEMSSLRNQLSNLEDMNKKIGRNFSSLLKTARAEIARKDKSIADLRTELEDLKFKRRWRTNHIFVDTSVPPPNFVPIAPTVAPLSFDPPSTLDDELEEEIKPNYQETIYGARLKKRLLEEKSQEEKCKEEQRKEESNKENSVMQLITEPVPKDDQPKNSTPHNLRNRKEIKRPPRNDELASYGFEGHRMKYDQPRIGPRTPSPEHHRSRDKSRNRSRLTNDAHRTHKDSRRDKPRDNEKQQDQRSKSLSRSRLHQGTNERKRKRLHSAIDPMSYKQPRIEEQDTKSAKTRGIKRKSSQEIASPIRTGLRKTTELQRSVYKTPEKSLVDDKQKIVNGKEHVDKGHEIINTKKNADVRLEVNNSKKNLSRTSVDERQEFIVQNKVKESQVINSKKNDNKTSRYVIPKKSASRNSVEEKQEVINSRKSSQQRNSGDKNREVINTKKSSDKKQEATSSEQIVDKKLDVKDKKNSPQKLVEKKRRNVDESQAIKNLTEKNREVINNERTDDKKQEIVNGKKNSSQNFDGKKQEIVNSERNLEKRQGVVCGEIHLSVNLVEKKQEVNKTEKQESVNNEKIVDKKQEVIHDEKQKVVNSKKNVDKKQDIMKKSDQAQENLETAQKSVNSKENSHKKQEVVNKKKYLLQNVVDTKQKVILDKENCDNKQEVNDDEKQKIVNVKRNSSENLVKDKREVINAEKMTDEKQKNLISKENLTQNTIDSKNNTSPRKQNVTNAEKTPPQKLIDEKQNALNIVEDMEKNLAKRDDLAQNLVNGKQEVINILNSSGDSPCLELEKIEPEVNPLQEQLSNDVTYMILESNISKLFSGIQSENVVESVSSALNQEVKAETKVEENNDLEDGEIPDSEDESLDKKLQTEEKTVAEAAKNLFDGKQVLKPSSTLITDTSPNKRHNNYRREKCKSLDDRRREDHWSKTSHHRERRRSRESPPRSKHSDKYHSVRDDRVRKQHAIPNLLSDAKENQTFNGFPKLQDETLTIQGSRVLKEPTVTKTEPNKTENSGINRSKSVVARRPSKDSKTDKSKKTVDDPKENLTTSPIKSKLVENDDSPVKEPEKSIVEQKVPHSEFFLCNKKALVINPESFTNPVKDNLPEINKGLVSLRRVETAEKPDAFEKFDEAPIDTVNLLGKGIAIPKKPTEQIINKSIVKIGQKIIIPRRRRPVVLSDSPPVVVVNCSTKI